MSRWEMRNARRDADAADRWNVNAFGRIAVYALLIIPSVPRLWPRAARPHVAHGSAGRPLQCQWGTRLRTALIARASSMAGSSAGATSTAGIMHLCIFGGFITAAHRHVHRDDRR